MNPSDETGSGVMVTVVPGAAAGGSKFTHDDTSSQVGNSSSTARVLDGALANANARHSRSKATGRNERLMCDLPQWQLEAVSDRLHRSIVV